MHPDLARFRFCPACAAPDLVFEDDKALRCGACGFRYFHNVAVAVGTILVHEDEVLLTRRARDPAADALDLPGGFVDAGESLESAVCREVREELALALAGDELRYLFSSTNRYLFEGTVYRTSDVYFGVRLPERPDLLCADDVSEAIWRRPGDALQERTGEALAFDSVRFAISRLADGGLGALLPRAR